MSIGARLRLFGSGPGLLLVATVVLAAVSGPVPAAGGGVGARFVKGVLAGESSERVTTLQFGPDGRLYVGQQNGLIKAYAIERKGPGDYAVIDAETIAAVQSIPNHNDDGTPNDRLFTRLLTGLLVTGDPEAPVVYATSSDPRIGGGPSGKKRKLDTNSGVLSRLSPEGALWRRLDLVRGLPRSEENHASNGLALSPDGRRLFIAQGSMTNQGAPSKHFALVPEYALSAAILAVDLAAVGESTYDLPTLSGPPPPFGGRSGLNQAWLDPGGPVQVWAPGFRNPYDVVVTASGRMYTIDNGANQGWGDAPEDEGPHGRCLNAASEGGPAQPDMLHFVSGPGYYGGHPNPTRAGLGRPLECDHRAGREAGGLVEFPASTNGLTEYRAGNLGRELAGDLLAAGFDNRIYRLELSVDGRRARRSVLFEAVGAVPLDVTAQGDDGPFPGTVWVGDFAAGSIIVFEPEDFPAAPALLGTGAPR